MLYLILGVLLVGGLMFVSDKFLKANPKILAKNIRRISGNGALVVAFLLLMTGRLLPAIPFAIIGYLLVGKLPFVWLDLGRSSGTRSGARSTVLTAMLELVHDHDSGTIDGSVRTGTFAGRRLSELNNAELNALLQEARQCDPQAARLLETYIARAGGRSGESRTARQHNAMGKEEALEVLGLKPGASREEILHAHRMLMKKMHPDLGGSTYLATKINEAKDVLLR